MLLFKITYANLQYRTYRTGVQKITKAYLYCDDEYEKIN